jgi:dihydrofolate reductase
MGKQELGENMTLVVTALAVSADGFIAGPNDGPGNPLGDGGERLFAWYTDGDIRSRFFPNFQLSAESAEVFDQGAARVGAIISGRRTYEISNAWGGKGPLPGVPLFVLTHNPPANAPDSDPSYTYVTTGIGEAVELAKQAAGEDKVVALMGSSPVRQALAHGLLDEITLHVVPVLLGAGVRLLDEASAELELESVVQAPGVTHVTYVVVR